MKLVLENQDFKIKEKEYVELNLLCCGSHKYIEISYKGQQLITISLNKKFQDLFKRRDRFQGIIESTTEKIVEISIIRYVDLHRHTGYSLLDGAMSISDMVKKTEYAGALTDHGVMFGILKYYKEMKSANKKPILGFEAYCESIDGKKESNHLVLLAKNNEGYFNIQKLSSSGYENFYNKPHINYDMLKKYSNGVIATSACIGGEIPKLLRQGKKEEAKKVVQKMVEIFGDDFYIEIQRHHFEEELKIEKELINLAKEMNIKIIATTDAHYLDKDDAFVQEILLCLQTGKTIKEPHWSFQGDGYYVHTSEEMEKLFADIPEALDNTLEIADKCNVELDLKSRYMPHFPIPAPFKSEEVYFEHLCWEGFEKRFKGTHQFNSLEYKERLEYEIGVIKRMGFPGYFIIVWDYVDFAKKNGIYVGPGRGSAVGSLVAYCLNIVDLDPIKYGLLFERFLNPERVSMPDIDIDFEFERREEVIEYVREKYGDICVSKIITFGTLGAKMIVRDVSRVLDLPYAVGDSIAKAIPVDTKMTLKRAFEESPEFKQMYETDRQVKEVIDISLKLEGLPRHCSIHACGLVIAPDRVSNFVPTILMENKDTGIKEVTCQFTMSEIEEMGLLKMDFLGLRTMGVIGKTLKMVNKKRIQEGKEALNYRDIPLNDKNVYKFISKGNTVGVFQLESQGMTEFMKQLFQDINDVPDKMADQLFERLIAGISLYRPGPLDEIPNYIKNMLNPKGIVYDLPQLKPILESTYNVIVYQEQCMEIVRELAGFSKGDADNVRKAFAKKKDKMIKPLGEKFIYGEVNDKGEITTPGCLKNGISEKLAVQIWSKMESFGSYAFNKSHAGGYAVIAIITAWLAYYYPKEYMTAMLNSFILNSDKLKIYLAVCSKKNISILSPHVNNSSQMFTTENQDIRFGLMGIKGLGKSSELIMNEKKERGDFKSYQDFAERMAKHQKVDKKILEALIYSGALDCFEGSRRAKLSILDRIIKNASIEKKNFISGQLDIFSIYDELKDFKKISTPNLEEFCKKIKLEKEKDYAGVYVTEHPLDDYIQYLKKEKVYDIEYILPQESLDENDDLESKISNSYDWNGKNIKVAGIIKNLKLFYTKKDNKPLYTFSIEDKTGELNAVIFSNKISLNQDKIFEGKIVIIQGQIKEDDRGTQIIVNSMFDIESIKDSETPKCIWVRAFNKNQLNKALTIIKSNEGDLPVYIKFNKQNYKSNFNFNFSYSTFLKLQEEFGTENVKIVYNK